MKRIPYIVLIVVFLITGLGFTPGLVPGVFGKGVPPKPGSIFPAAVTPGAPGAPINLFMPFINRLSTGSIAGKVVDTSSRPIQGVTVVADNGANTSTDNNGNYQLSGLPSRKIAVSASKQGYIFSPSAITLDLNGTATNQNFSAMAAASNVIVNGDFEAGTAPWEIPATTCTAAITTTLSFSPSHSGFTGIVNPTPNVNCYSSFRQVVTIPVTTTSAVLKMWLQPLVSPIPITKKPATALPEKPTGKVFGNAPLATDVQYVLVLDPISNAVLETLFWQQSYLGFWGVYGFNLTKYAGQQIKIEIGTFNDGLGDKTAMYIDDVSVTVNGPSALPTPTPTPTSTITTTVTPPPCNNNLIRNPGFELNTVDWITPATPVTAGRSNGLAHTGTWSMRTGDSGAQPNILSYSDAFQDVTIPFNSTSDTLGVWLYRNSTDTLSRSLPAAPVKGEHFGKAPLAFDVQYILVLDVYGRVLDQLYWQRVNAPAWTFMQFDVTRFRGLTVRLLFGTFNDGLSGFTSMYVDDVVLDSCPSSGATATFTPVPSVTVTPVLTCTETINNGGFETQNFWFIPWTAFSAQYSTLDKHSGLWSMLAGIFYPAFNRFSYSDFEQLVTIPFDAKTAQLTYWYRPISTGMALNTVVNKPTLGSFKGKAVAVDNDVQYLLILDFFGNWIDTKMWLRANSATWTSAAVPLESFRGNSIRLHYGVFNDGFDGATSMFVDDVSLQVCK